MAKWVFGLALYAAAWLNLAYLIGLGISETLGGLAVPDPARVWQGLGHVAFSFLLWATTIAASRGLGFRGPLPRLRRRRGA